MTTIKPSDPRLTAFVLGELSEEESVEIQTAVEQSVELQEEVQAIRHIAAQIETVMQEESLPLAAAPCAAQLRKRKRWLLPAAITVIAAALVVAVLLPFYQEYQDMQIAKQEPVMQEPAESQDPVIPAQAGIQTSDNNADSLDSRLHGSDEPEQAGIQTNDENADSLDSRLRGSDEQEQAGIQTNNENAVALDSRFRGSDEEKQEPETASVVQVAPQAEVPSIPVVTASPPPPPASPPAQQAERIELKGNSDSLSARESERSVPVADSPPPTSPPAEQTETTGEPQVFSSGMPFLYGGIGGNAGGDSGTRPADSPRVQGGRPMQRATAAQARLSFDGINNGAGGIRMAQQSMAMGKDIQPMPMPTVPPRRPPSPRPEPPTYGAQRRLMASNLFNEQRDEAYKDFTENDFQAVKMGEFSTFSVDVDTAAYTTMRRYVSEMNRRPPADAVRLEEYINYFKYDYAQPTDNKPFATHVDVFACPWQPKHLLARIGIKGKEYTVDKRPSLNLVFLVDVSGSMASANRLPLVQKGLTELVEMLQPKDRVAIVTYAGDSRLVLPSVSGQEKRAILDSVEALTAGGSTNGAGGIRMAYDTARKYFDKAAQNRVILCTDGDFNVGTTDNKSLEQIIGDEAKSGVFLTILGFGMGNYKDDRLKTLSMRGNGNYGYIDSIEECRKLLVEGLTGTLFTIAKDVKIQVDFNPAAVSGYRLLGYENRKLRDEDFHNDAVDAGDIGAGHTVTALYEIVPIGVNVPTAVDRSRYDTTNREPATVSPESGDTVPDSLAEELMFVKLRYKEPDGDKSSLLEFPVKRAGGISPPVEGDSQFASAVALYGMLLRSSRHSGNGSWNMVLELATPNTKDDKYREEFVELVKKAKDLR